MQLITNDLVALDADLGATKDAVIASLAQLVADAGRADAAGLTADAMEREGKAATGLPGGFAIPHCRSAAVSQASLAFARLSRPVDFDAKDGPSDLVFLIAAAADGDADHLKLLTQLARALIKKDFLASLRAAKSPDEIVALVTAVVQPAPAAAPVAAAVTTALHVTGSASANVFDTGSGDDIIDGAGGAVSAKRRTTVWAVAPPPRGRTPWWLGLVRMVQPWRHGQP